MQRNNAVVLQCGATCNIQQCAAWCGQGCDVARHSLRESVVEEFICEREYIGVPRVVLDHLLLLLFHSYVVATARHGCNATVLHRSCTELSAALSTRSQLPVAPHRCSLLTSTTPNSAIHSRHLCLRVHERSQRAVRLPCGTRDGTLPTAIRGSTSCSSGLGYSRGTLGVVYLVLQRVGVGLRLPLRRTQCPA
jgi:hypothetical protein